MKHAYVLDLLERRLAPRRATVCVIGDGLANFVAPALELSDSFARVVSVNLPEILLTDLQLLEETGMDAESIRLVTDEKEILSVAA
ncbi:MAG: hypothetical protein ACKOA5_02985, partial [Actinomycetota bacterium]